MFAETRFIRAYAYLQLMDMYANVPLVTKVSTELPLQSNRTEIFDFVEKEISLGTMDENIIASELGAIAAWALLSRLYLNATVYIGTDKNSKVIEFEFPNILTL